METFAVRFAALLLVLGLSACTSTRTSDYFTPPSAPAPVARGSMLWPVADVPHIVNSGYGVQRHRGHTFHRGLDIGAPRGATVIAAAAGFATVGNDGGGYGHFIVIDHGNGLSTLYGHLLETRVRDGDRVAAGQYIGRVGKSGNATGYHLHFEVQRNGKTADPNLYLQRSAPSLAKSE